MNYSGRNVGIRETNITNSLDNLYIHCSLTSNSVVDGKYGDIIRRVSFVNMERSYPFNIEPLRVRYYELNTHTIKSIRIYITDPLGRIINVNNIHSSFDLTIKEVK